ncbi:MAG: tRNA adenosine(34) deaminase TadA [Pseudomonadota bacterium]|nr:tRNA adenosine(34) deaminase TadA [Pseudomonadota bacterium]
MQDQRFMARALELAHTAQELGEVPVGAVLVLNDQIIAEGYNQPIAHHDPTAHSEIMALRAGAKHLNNYRLVDTTLYVTLEPCAMCVGAMIHARIKRLVFAASDRKTGAVCSAAGLIDASFFNHRIQWEQGVLAQASGQLLQHFFQAKRLRSVV